MTLGSAARLGWLAAATWLLAACHTPAVHSSDAAMLARPELAFLTDGATTRTEVLLRLGEPAAVFEAGRILTYQLERRGDGSLRTRIPHTGAHELGRWELSLVMVFGPRGVLDRHNLVVAE